MAFSTSGRATPTAARKVGLYHLAWEVGTLAELVETRKKLLDAGALVGESDHRLSKSLYAKDPSGIEFEVLWRVPLEDWDAGAGPGRRLHRPPRLGPHPVPLGPRPENRLRRELPHLTARDNSNWRGALMELTAAGGRKGLVGLVRLPGGFGPSGARSRAVATTRATIVMTMAIGSVWGSEADGTNATTANATATPPNATARAAITRRVSTVRRASSRASLGSRVSMTAKDPRVASASVPNPAASGTRPARVTAGSQSKIIAISTKM